jgi:hypothetical protein
MDELQNFFCAVAWLGSPTGELNVWGAFPPAASSTNVFDPLLASEWINRTQQPSFPSSSQQELEDELERLELDSLEDELERLELDSLDDELERLDEDDDDETEMLCDELDDRLDEDSLDDDRLDEDTDPLE